MIITFFGYFSPKIRKQVIYIHGLDFFMVLLLFVFFSVVNFVVEEIFGVDVIDLGTRFFLLLRSFGYLVGQFFVLDALTFYRLENWSQGF